jgi:hypothetical protein
MIFATFFLSSPSVEDLSMESSQKILNKAYLTHIPFIENRGQIEDESLKYYAKTFAGTVFVRGDGQIVYSLPYLTDSHPQDQNSKIKGWVITESLVGTSSSEVSAGGKAITKVNHFK